MLEHEPQEMPVPQIPAAQRRVSAEELTRAVSTLEDAKAAERMAGVAPIGQVVDELGLDSTPEEIWAQVQKQRVQAAAQTPPAQSFAVTPPKTRPRRRVRWWAIAVVGAVAWGALHNTTSQTSPSVTTISRTTNAAPPVVITSGQTVTISGDGQDETILVKNKNVVVSGNGNNITLQGQARSVTVGGDGNNVSGDAPKASSITGDGNNVQWSSDQ